MFRMGLSLQHFNRYTEEGEDFMARIVTGDKSWEHHFQSESKISSMKWKYSTSPKKKKVQVDSISPQGYAHRVLGHVRGHTAEIPASRWESECRVVLHHSSGTPTGYSPQVTWTPDNGSDFSG